MLIDQITISQHAKHFLSGRASKGKALFNPSGYGQDFVVSGSEKAMEPIRKWAFDLIG